MITLMIMLYSANVIVFFFNDPATTEIYTYCHTLSLHDALPSCLLPAPLRSGGTFRAPRLLFFRAGRFHSGKQCARQRIEIERIGSGGRDKLAKLLDLLHLQRPGLVAKGFQLRVIVARFAHHSLPRARKLKPQDSMIARARNRSEQKMRRSQSQETTGV